MNYTLQNQSLAVTVSGSGAEMVSVTSRPDGKEYLFDADPAYWKRHAPVLFPIVGSLKDKKLVIGGKDYPMGQHGFARDREFRLVHESESELRFELESDEETKKLYPYDFRLVIGYELSGAEIRVTWKVENTGTEPLHYQIGGHPAFYCPVDSFLENQSDYFLKFDSARPVSYRLLNENGLLLPDEYALETEDGFFRIPEDLFDRDALIIEGAQSKAVSLCRPDRKPYLTVLFDAPLYGIWSPAGKKAPFICIEPWWGRADRADFAGEISEREYDQALEAGEAREYAFSIRIDDVLNRPSGLYDPENCPCEGGRQRGCPNNRNCPACTKNHHEKGGFTFCERKYLLKQ